MEKEKQVNIVKDLILDGKITELSDIFNYIDKKFIHTKTGINYYRLLRCTKNPKLFTIDDTYTIARVLKVTPPAIANLIFGQLDAKKKVK
jgi:hypothetical protein